jgi:hypothetical protein
VSPKCHFFVVAHITLFTIWHTNDDLEPIHIRALAKTISTAIPLRNPETINIKCKSKRRERRREGEVGKGGNFHRLIIRKGV